MKLSKQGKLTIAAIAIAGLIIGLVLGYVVPNNVTSAGNKLEAGLNSQYTANQTSLSNCEVQTQQSVQVVKGQTDAIDRIITDAVKGRYSAGANSPQVDNGKFFSAIAEAYPNVNNVANTFSNLLAIVNGCRKDYQTLQVKMASMLGQFAKWRTGSWTTRTFGGGDFPNKNLIARLGDSKIVGQAAEDEMWKVVLTGSTLKEYQSHTLDPSTLDLGLGGNTTAAATTTG